MRATHILSLPPPGLAVLTGEQTLPWTVPIAASLLAIFQSCSGVIGKVKRSSSFPRPWTTRSVQTGLKPSCRHWAHMHHFRKTAIPTTREGCSCCVVRVECNWVVPSASSGHQPSLPMWKRCGKSWTAHKTRGVNFMRCALSMDLVYIST